MNQFPVDILMVEPTYFEVKYRINPYMMDSSGNLQTVNQSVAARQWQALMSAFVSLNLKVDTLNGVENLPDMVFSANQTFPFYREGKPSLLLSKMAHEARQDEVNYFKNWAKENGVQVYTLENEGPFEGTGDLIWNQFNGKVFGGHGPRTSEEVYREVEQIIDRPVMRLKLISDDFYHLDTCFSVLSETAAIIVEDAFCSESLALLNNEFSNLITISSSLAKSSFLGNCFCPDGKNIITHPFDDQTTRDVLEKLGFNIIEVDTSEFMKSGGSVFCMKMALFQAQS